MRMKLPDTAQAKRAFEICQRLGEAGHRALFAGGCVRDFILDRVPKDYDITTSAAPNQVAALFPHTVMVGAKFGVCVVVTDEGHFEVAQFRRDGPYEDGRRPESVEFADEREDAFRRDFTINALYLELPASWQGEATVLDYVDGIADIEGGILRAVGNPEQRFEEDHLRLLRAVRFAARFGYEIAEDTWTAIRRHAGLITRTSAERIRDEITRILTEGSAGIGLTLLHDSGLLAHVLPEVEAMWGVEQPPEFHPEGDVFTHTRIMLEGLPHDVSHTLAWAVLLHDVGKPVTQTFEDRIRFNLHDKAGVHLADRILTRLRFSNDDSKRIISLVENHMRLECLADMREAKRIRFLREDYVPELLELCRLDCLSSHGDVSTVEWAGETRAKILSEPPPVSPLLNGHALMAMGFKAGPLLREIHEAMLDAQMERAINTEAQAVEWVLERWRP
jgi:poly(A) polymerase